MWKTIIEASGADVVVDFTASGIRMAVARLTMTAKGRPFKYFGFCQSKEHQEYHINVYKRHRLFFECCTNELRLGVGTYLYCGGQSGSGVTYTSAQLLLLLLQLAGLMSRCLQLSIMVTTSVLFFNLLMRVAFRIFLYLGSGERAYQEEYFKYLHGRKASFFDTCSLPRFLGHLFTKKETTYRDLLTDITKASSSQAMAPLNLTTPVKAEQAAPSTAAPSSGLAPVSAPSASAKRPQSADAKAKGVRKAKQPKVQVEGDGDEQGSKKKAGGKGKKNGRGGGGLDKFVFPKAEGFPKPAQGS